jgi:hypothetical protein
MLSYTKLQGNNMAKSPTKSVPAVTTTKLPKSFIAGWQWALTATDQDLEEAEAADNGAAWITRKIPDYQDAMQFQAGAIAALEPKH